VVCIFGVLDDCESTPQRGRGTRKSGYELTLYRTFLSLLNTTIIRYLPGTTGYKRYCLDLKRKAHPRPEDCPYCKGDGKCLIRHGTYGRKALGMDLPRSIPPGCSGISARSLTRRCLCFQASVILGSASTYRWLFPAWLPSSRIGTAFDPSPEGRGLAVIRFAAGCGDGAAMSSRSAWHSSHQPLR